MLHRAQLERPPNAIGRNTTHALQSGILLGYVGLVEGMVERFQKEIGPGAKVIAIDMGQYLNFGPSFVSDTLSLANQINVKK